MDKNSSLEWNGTPPAPGWYWLIRRRDQALRMAYFEKFGPWRVSDSIGRTVCLSELKVGRLYTLGAAVTPPQTPET